MAQSKKRTRLLCFLILAGFLGCLYILNQKNYTQNNVQHALLDGPIKLISNQETSRKAIPSEQDLAKLPRDGGDQYNRLVFEKSPYLLQHAANPVDWFPWGDEAFQKAKRENKPIFLSIGYVEIAPVEDLALKNFMVSE
ncbi:MAG: DUF255 domain-containing protein [Phycisphaeraceae bacterium]|nr:DUF255 domain-containing protein [Phycisphaeraceae bacterium]